MIKKTHYLSILLTIIIIINIVIYAYIKSGKLIPPIASYNALYLPTESLRIEGFELKEKDKLKIKILPLYENVKCEIIRDNEKVDEQDFISPIIKLMPDKHNYHLNPITEKKHLKSIKLVINFTPKEIYAAHKNSNTDNYYIENVNVSIGDLDLYPVSDWIMKYEHIPEGEIKETIEIITNKIGINTNEPSLTKIEKIGHYLLKELSGKQGIPSDSLQFLSPLNQFKCAKKGVSKIWCGNFAEIYTYFANQAGIPTRTVGIDGEIDGVRVGGHTFSESYVKEQNKWAYTDLFYNKIYVSGLSGDVLNSVDILNINNTGTYNNIWVKSIQQGSLIDTAYAIFSELDRNLFSNNIFLVFTLVNQEINSLSEKIKRYFFNKPYYLSYSFSSNNSDQIRLVKNIFFYLFLFILLIWIINFRK
ncbi:hypothetical protein JYT51_01425 [Candidatus Amoebophilus asiaticus]|nr:hypothetical protein [Candidatus Amoebophilus asiaticus]